MAKCKRCKVNIPDGTEYCKDCLNNENDKSNESYLDSLLNSVKYKAPATEAIYKKKDSSYSMASADRNEDELNIKNEISSDNEFDTDNDDFYHFDLNDIEDFDQFSMDDDISDFSDEFDMNNEDIFLNDLKDSDLNENITYNMPLYNQEEIAIPDKEKEGQTLVTKSDKIDNNNITDKAESTITERNKAERNKAERNIIESNITESNKAGQDAGIYDLPEDISASENFNEINNDEDYHDDINNLLDSLETMQNTDDQMGENGNFQSLEEETNKLRKQALEEDASFNNEVEDLTQTQNSMDDEDDFLSLLSQIASDDPVAEDVRAIGDLISGNSAENIGIPSDVGDVFSDALKVVSGLNDLKDEFSLQESSKISKKSKKEKKRKKEKNKKKRNKQSTDNLENQQDADVTGKPKKGLLNRLFGNVEDNKIKKKSKGTNKTPANQGENLPEDNSKKAAKGKKGAGAKASAPKDTKADKKNASSKKNKKVKEKKIKTKEVIQVIDEIDDDIGRINRLGATIVFIFFGLLAALICVGTNAVTYTLSIQHASTYFDEREYNRAYNEVYGMTFKAEDMEIYDKIRTVMYVNKQLNSYNNYYCIDKYPEALDSLLKGLKRYDKYIELAKLLGIKPDMDYVREQILAELKREFNISEKEAIKINRIENKKNYSLKVFDLAIQKNSKGL